ncbi:MAG: histidyl-tRNA synthetase [Candidatus Paceibacteria bacterium]|jgi:histidyl-tRNA synthetase
MSEKIKSNKDILQAPRGMRDFSGSEYYRRGAFFKHAQDLAESYGFFGIETPIMEHTEIFLKGIGEGTDIIDKEMYNLTTLGGDRLTLRPEGTAPVMRSYIEHGMGSLPQPQLFHYSGPYFRHDKPQKGRYRQLYQFGLEIMGSKNPLYDALIIEVGYKIIQATDQKIVVKLNSLGTSELRKTYTEKLVAFYIENKDALGERDQERIATNPFRILDSKDAQTVMVNQSAPTLVENLDEESQKHFDTVTSLLNDIGIPYEIDPFLVRGMDYYEHTVFEYVTYDTEGNESFALGGGGRYDGLAEMIGHNQSIPAVGLGLGADRIIESNEDAFISGHYKRIPLLITDSNLYKNAVDIIQSSDTPLFLYPLTTKIAKQISRMEKEGYQKIAILGEDEVANKTIIIKNLEKHEQEEVVLTDLNNYIKG